MIIGPYGPPSSRVDKRYGISWMRILWVILGVTIGGGALNFPFSRAKISFGVFVRSENLSGLRSGLCLFLKPFLKFGLFPPSDGFQDEDLGSLSYRRLINPGWVIPCINPEILMHFGAPSTSRTSALLAFPNRCPLDLLANRSDLFGRLSNPNSGDHRGSVLLKHFEGHLACWCGLREYPPPCLLLGSVRAVGVLDSE
ncbi:hypothetical protein Tco_0486801 [Tanacetum coccineum]